MLNIKLNQIDTLLNPFSIHTLSEFAEICDTFSSMNLDENQEFLVELANAKMPFGKYAGRYLLDLPETYILWFKEKGYPQGKLGLMMELLMEIQLNGLESLLRPLRKE